MHIGRSDAIAASLSANRPQVPFLLRRRLDRTCSRSRKHSDSPSRRRSKQALRLAAPAQSRQCVIGVRIPCERASEIPAAFPLATKSLQSGDSGLQSRRGACRSSASHLLRSQRYLFVPAQEINTNLGKVVRHRSTITQLPQIHFSLSHRMNAGNTGHGRHSALIPAIFVRDA